MKALVLTVSMFFAFQAVAGNGEGLVNRVIKRSVSYPEALKAQGAEAKVTTTVLVMEDGSLKILSIHSSSTVFKAEIVRQIEGIKLKNYKQFIGQEFSYTFNFKVQ